MVRRDKVRLLLLYPFLRVGIRFLSPGLLSRFGRYPPLTSAIRWTGAGSRDEWRALLEQCLRLEGKLGCVWNYKENRLAFRKVDLLRSTF